MNITAAGVTYFDPVAMNLNPVVPGVFHFTTINVAAGSTLKFTESKYHGAAYFLASGDVTIAGALDLDGEGSYGCIGFASQRIPNAAGSGGFSGGMGGFGTNAPLPGNGPGRGAVTGGAESPHGTNTSNEFVVPLVGGSGGGGTAGGSNGGAGGGAILIASSTTITLTGNIYARGGNGSGDCGRAAGAGGAVRLVANTLAVGSGGVFVQVGGSGTPAGHGIARFESNNLGGYPVVGKTTRSTPFALNLPSAATPSIRVSSINGQPINSNPFSFPDITINATSQIPIVIQAQNVPVGTVAKIYVFSETGPDRVVDVGPLTGTLASSTATANITYPAGGTRGYVKATW